MHQYANQRSDLPRRFEGYPAYGAVHEIVPNTQLRNFLFDFTRISDRVFEKYEDDRRGSIEVNPIPDFVPDDTSFDSDEIVIKSPAIDDESDYDPRKYYRVFDLETMGVSVVEMEPASHFANKFRTVFESQDFGAVQKEAQTEIGRHPQALRRQLLFNRVESVGRIMPNVPEVVPSGTRQKLALFPDTSEYVETLELLEDEANIIHRALQRRLKQYVRPTDQVTHLTFNVFRREARPEQIREIKAEVNKYLAKHNPVGLRLDDLTFRSRSERSSKTKRK